VLKDNGAGGNVTCPAYLICKYHKQNKLWKEDKGFMYIVTVSLKDAVKDITLV